MCTQDIILNTDAVASSNVEDEARIARGYELGFLAGTRDTNVLLHELQIHQFELEIQNEELLLTQLTLAASRDRYFDLYEFAPVGYFTITHEGLITEVNLKAATLLGLDRSNLVQRHFATIVADQDKDRWHILFQQMKATIPEPQSSFDLCLIHSDRSKFNAHLDYLRTDDANDAPEFRITLTDITQIITAEEKLRQSEALLHSVIDSVPSHIIVLDRNGLIVATNAAWRQFASENMEESLKNSLSSYLGLNYIELCDLCHGDSLKGASDERSGILAVLAGRSPSFNIEYPCHSALQQRWFLGSVSPLGAHNDGVVITHTDITQRKQAEEKLRVAAIAFESQEGIFITDADTVILEVNQAFISLTGYSAAEAVGQSAKLLNSGHHDEAFYAGIRQNLDQLGIWQGEIWNQHKNAEIHPEWMTITAVPDKSGVVTHYVATLTDASADIQREAQRLIDEASHRDSLVREVHHRIKNNLQGVIGLLRSFSTQQPKLAAPINDAINQVQSIAVIHGLQGRKLSKVILSELVREIVKNHQILFKTKIIIDIPEKWTPCRINELETVPMALVLNELISNAVKHSNPETQSEVTIRFSREGLSSSVKVVITNSGQLPFEMTGTGLQLVASLLPKAGADLTWQQDGHNVMAQLILTAPIINFEDKISSHSESINP